MLHLRNRHTISRQKSARRNRRRVFTELLEKRILLSGDGGGAFYSAIDESDFSEYGEIGASAHSDSPAAPVVDVAFFAAFEFAPAGTVVGVVRASDANGGTLRYRLLDDGNNDLDGDGDRPFRLDGASGKLIVNDSDDLDLSLLPASIIALRVRVSDPGGLVGEAVQLVDIHAADPALTVEDVSTDEGGNLLFTVTLDKAVPDPF